MPELNDILNEVIMTDTSWDDLSVELSAGSRGALSVPNYDATNLGLLFPQNDASEIAFATIQMKHRKKLGSAIKLHVHYIQSEATQPTFKIDYKFYNNNEVVPGSWTTISTGTGTGADKGIFTWSSGDLLQIATFPDVAAPTGETVSANLDIKLYREDNDLTGDVLAKYVDLHFEIDSLGSDAEYSK